MARRPPARPGFITAASFAALGLVGVFHTILGTAVPEMRRFFRIDLVQAGWLGSTYWAGFTAAVLVAGVLADEFSRSTVLAGACILTGLGAALLGLQPHLGINLLFIFLIGAGTGAIVSSSSALLLELHSGREGSVMNLHHFFYALGATAGPAAMAWSLGPGGWGWQALYRIGGIVSLLLGPAFLFSFRSAGRSKPGFAGAAVLGIVREPRMLLLIALAITGIGTQNGVIYWLVSFLQSGRGFPVFLAGLGLTLLSIGMAAGRLILVGLAPRIGYPRSLLFLFLLTNVFFLLIFLSRAQGAVLALCFLAGLAFSGLFPVLLALGGALFPRRSGTAVGFVSLAAGAGSSLMPWAIAKAAEAGSLTWGLATGAAAALAGLCLSAFSLKRLAGPHLP